MHPLNEGRELQAIWRFASWQARARLAGRPLVFDWVAGARLQASLGDTGLTGNHYNGLQEFEEMAFLLHCLRSDDLFVDVGANAGCYTVLASRVVGSRTVAFEPVPSTFQKLVANVELNQIEALVELKNLGVGAENGHLRFSSGDDTMNHVLADEEEDTNAVTVDVRRLDEELHAPPHILKIDVEGFEQSVLDGAVGHLRSDVVVAVVLELNGSGERYGVSDASTASFMRDLGYAPHRYEPLARNLFPVDGKNQGSNNTVFLKDVDLVHERVRSGPSFVVNGVRF